MPKIKIETVEQVINRDNKPVAGIGKNDKPWSLWRVNDEYSFFHFGAGKPALVAGQEMEFNLKEEMKNGYLQKTISFPNKEDKIIDALREVYKKLISIEEKFDSFTKIFIEKQDEDNNPK